MDTARAKMVGQSSDLIDMFPHQYATYTLLAPASGFRFSSVEKIPDMEVERERPGAPRGWVGRLGGWVGGWMVASEDTCSISLCCCVRGERGRPKQSARASLPTCSLTDCCGEERRLLEALLARLLGIAPHPARKRTDTGGVRTGGREPLISGYRGCLGRAPQRHGKGEGKQGLHARALPARSGEHTEQMSGRRACVSKGAVRGHERASNHGVGATAVTTAEWLEKGKQLAPLDSNPARTCKYISQYSGCEVAAWK